MRGSLLALLGTAALLFGAASNAQQPSPAARPGAASAGSKGVNVGSLSCSVAGGVGFVFGSTKGLNCIFTRTDGLGERYEGSVEHFGVDIGYTKDAQIVWLVFAPGDISSGALARRIPAGTVMRFIIGENQQGIARHPGARGNTDA